MCFSMPTTTCTKSFLVSVRPLSRVAFCRQPWSFVAHRCPLSPHVASCSLMSSSKFICISESPLQYAYTTHDDVNPKIVAAKTPTPDRSCLVLNTSPSRTTPVVYSWRAPIRPRPKRTLAQPRRTTGKALRGRPSRQKRFSLFSRSMFPSK